MSTLIVGSRGASGDFGFPKEMPPVTLIPVAGQSEDCYVPAAHLPIPPQDDELWWYFGRQHRHLSALLRRRPGRSAEHILFYESASVGRRCDGVGARRWRSVAG